MIRMPLSRQQFEKNAGKLSASAILAIPDDEPERLFPEADQSSVTSVHRRLAMKWHPDRNKDPKASDVFDRVTKLKDRAIEKLEAGTWQKPGELLLTPIKGKQVKIRFLKKHDFELGEFYISKFLVTFLVRKEFSDLFENGVKRIQGLAFANNEMREKTERTLPQIHRVFETSTHHVLTLKKGEDFVLARDLHDHVGPKVEPRHVAWMISRLHNIGCYLQWSGLVHNGVSLDTCFVSPENHSISLLGGWWYATPEDEKLIGLPTQTLNSVPRRVIDSGVADKRTDMALLRAFAKEMLGDKTGVRLSRDKDIPKPMSNWVSLPGSGDSFQDYTTWLDKVVLDSFGKRRFQHFDVTPREIYQPLTKGA